MEINFKQLKLYRDNYNISNLIKKIDKNYRLYFDTKNKLFMVLDITTKQKCFESKTITPNIIRILQQTRVENSNQIFADIERHNKLLEDNILSSTKQKAADTAVDIANYLKRVNRLTDSDIKKIIEGKNA